MFPSEIEILMNIARNKDSARQLVNQPKDVISEYIGYFCDYLAMRGYINGYRGKGYKLTEMGKRALIDALKERTTRAKDTIIALRQLSQDSAF